MAVRVEIIGLNEAKWATRRFPADVKTGDLRERNDVADYLANVVRASARASSAQSALMVPTVQSEGGDEPTVVVGGSLGVGRHGNPAYKILFGAVFGAVHLKQFRPQVGDDGYWMFRDLTTHDHRVAKAIDDAADYAMRRIDG